MKIWQRGGMNKTDADSQLLAALVKGDRSAAVRVIEEWSASRTYQAAVSELLEPALNAFGEQWHRGNLSLSHGYIAGKTAEYLMERCLVEQRDLGSGPGEKKGIVVTGNIEDDYHALGRMMLSRFLEISGWQVHDLGNDVLAEACVDAALETGAGVIAVSAMMYTNALNIRKVRRELDDRGLTGRLQLAVGGAVFNARPTLVKEVGGDGTAVNAFKAVALMDDLWQKSGRGEKR